MSKCFVKIRERVVSDQSWILVEKRIMGIGQGLTQG